MRKIALVLALSAMVFLPAATCLGTNEKAGQTLGATGSVLTTAAPLLPGPWGLIVGALGAVATTVGSVFAQKAQVAGGVANPVAQGAVAGLTSHNWIFPVAAAAATALSANHIVNIPPDLLYSLIGISGIPELVEQFGKKAAPTTSTTAASPVEVKTP